MKLYRKRDLKRCGIYCIRNTINNKVYIGKSINIYGRIRVHINCLNKKSKNENLHFINAWHKYGRNVFEYYVIEDLTKNDDLIKERELYWMKTFQSINPKKGYNIRMDSSTGIIISEETRKKLSDSQIERFKDPQERARQSKRSKLAMANLETRKRISKGVSETKKIYNFYQYDKNMNFVQKWESVKDIIQQNPSFKWQNIYAVCNGYKPSYMGYVWKKELKI